MKKIGDVTNTADKNGEFTNGNISTGTPPTILEGPWLTAVQREILNVLVKAGVVQDPNKDNQLAMSIEKIAKSSVPKLVHETGSSENAIMSQKAVTDAISDSQVNVPDASTQVKGKVKLTGVTGESEELVMHQKAASDLFDGQQNNITEIKSLFPQAIHSFSGERVVVEVKEANALQGKGEIYSYRKTKSGWWLQEAIVTGQYSGGASLPSKNCPAWRLGTLKIAPHILTLKQTAVAKSDGVFTYDFTPSQFSSGDKKDTVRFYQMRGGEEEFVEFETTTTEKEISILFAGTLDTPNDLKVEIYVDSTLLSTERLNTVGEFPAPNLTAYISCVKNPRPGTKLRVRVTKEKDVNRRWAYIAGINANFDNHVADDIDKIYTSTYTSKAVRTTQSGAMCYVFYEKGAGKFGGESHGGETPISQKFIIDAKDRTLKNGEIFSCESLRIVQETIIDYENGHKIDCFTEHRFNGDGTHEFTGSFVPTANFQAAYAYCPMFTVDFSHFKKIRTPEYYDIKSYPEGSNIQIEYPINNYEIQSADDFYTAGIVWSTSLKNVDSSRVAIKPYPTDSSTKLYAGLSTGKTITLEKFTCHQLRYYY
ncbi:MULTISPECIES: hypothetical protein [Providencia]|uniref:hypothetical protein n=1 Tax=Providencia TaxID=586 RepID=UPI0018C57A00|nr:hypothetical protein [Providencia rettgeri]MBG5927894.1 hypothetical protein [Providencia rettgeri]